MRFNGQLLVASAAVLLAACGGGDKAKTDSTAAAPQAAPAAAAATVPAAPATGATHEVKMIGDGTSYKFDPADITIKEGDAIKFVIVSGAPHNVSFDPAAIPADVKPQLSANMKDQSAELQSPILMNPNDSYTISFAKIKPGKYEVRCPLHLAMNMKGTITVQ
jgi:plastocyanin